MSKKSVVVVGSTGRMGQEILNLLKIDSDLVLSGEVDEKKNISQISDADIVIDFSAPAVSVEVSQWCRKKIVPYVCGTTGFSEKQFHKITEAAKDIPIFYSSNMSVGVAVLRRALKALAAVSEYDFQIVEAHHSQKKDSPSGTAKTLQEELTKVIGRTPPPVQSIRGGGVFGVHEILVMGQEETLEFKHTALNRAVFARGALRAAKFLIGQKPGLYSMDDVLDY